jgi:hypothetical protein
VTVLGLILIMAPVAPESSQVVIRDIRGPGVVEQAIVLPPGRLNRSVAESMAREFFGRYGGTNSILLLTMGENELEVRASLYHECGPIQSGGQPTSEKIANFLQDVTRAGQPKRPLARLMALGRNAVLAYRDGGGLSERLLAGTRDPTQMAIAGVVCRLLHISVSEAGKAIRDTDRYGVRFYFRASPRVSHANCVSLLKRLAALTRIRYIDVEMRPDAWFIESSDYPLVPVFTQDVRPPNAAEYLLAPHLSCGLDNRGRVRCSGSNFEP